MTEYLLSCIPFESLQRGLPVHSTNSGQNGVIAAISYRANGGENRLSVKWEFGESSIYEEHQLDQLKLLTAPTT